jgi:DNA processing protein
MNSGADTAALVALLRTGKRPAHVYGTLVEEANGAVSVLEEEQGLLAAELLGCAAAELTGWLNEGLQVLTILDPDYPENLRAVHDRPPLIFVAGRLEPRDARSVAVIGTRAPSEAGVALSRAISEELVDAGYTVVSGLAAGIDTAAHTAALVRRARTVAVIGTGLRRSYPRQNAELQRRIAAEGAVISQFWPDAPPSRRSFPQRNATMSGIALATVVVEASRTSGARTQARLALAHGRPVLVAEPLLEQQWANDLVGRPATHVFRSPADVTEVVERLSSTDTLVG